MNEYIDRPTITSYDHFTRCLYVFIETFMMLLGNNLIIGKEIIYINIIWERERERACRVFLINIFSTFTNLQISDSVCILQCYKTKMSKKNKPYLNVCYRPNIVSHVSLFGNHWFVLNQMPPPHAVDNWKSICSHFNRYNILRHLGIRETIIYNIILWQIKQLLISISSLISNTYNSIIFVILC